MNKRKKIAEYNDAMGRQVCGVGASDKVGAASRLVIPGNHLPAVRRSVDAPTLVVQCRQVACRSADALTIPATEISDTASSPAEAQGLFRCFKGGQSSRAPPACGQRGSWEVGLVVYHRCDVWSKTFFAWSKVSRQFIAGFLSSPEAFVDLFAEIPAEAGHRGP